MARIEESTNSGEVAERIRLRRGGRLTPLDGVLLHSPPVADGWNQLLGAVRTQTTLPAPIRELAILRVAELNGAAYEWRAHEPVARATGLTDAQLKALRRGADTTPLTERQRLALAYTDAMTRDIAVPDDLFDALSAFFDDRQIVELTATVGIYNLVSRFLIALRVGSEESEAAERTPYEDGATA
jgi:AhpD family alkylhydroperoxidase